MIIVGIDIAKNKHDVIIIDSNGNTLTKSFRISNSHCVLGNISTTKSRPLI
ncbi:IS110 family transposase [Cellulosilyticum sp. I15G10I2]|uniref:IS110 family transposase n=1 Tax=Cellulosilyticum sp. I15G10I2 TaxID=1892843 RepID=UPI00114D36F6